MTSSRHLGRSDDAPTHDDDGLGDHAQALLDAYRVERQIPAAVHDRVWQRVHQDHGHAPVRAANHDPRARAIRGFVLGGLAAAAVMLLWVGGRSLLSANTEREAGNAAGYEQRDQSQGGVATPAHRPRAIAPAEAAPPTPAPIAVPTETAETSEIDDGALPHAVTPSPRNTDRSRPAPPQTRPSTVTPPVADDDFDDGLLEENRLLGLARTALLERDPRRALDHLDEHARRFPRGVLTQERQALRAVGLCEAHDDEQGITAARAFLHAHPRAALADRVRASCFP